MSLLRRRMMMAASEPSGSLPDYSAYRGVYIEDVDGYLYTEAEWDGSKTANGVAVLTDDCRFVVALKDTSMYTTWGGYGTLVEGIAVTEDIFGAMWDFDGKSNTSFALESLGNHLSGAPAAYKCKNYIFPNGKDGYLGAGGEWQAVLNNLASVLNAIVKCGGDTFNGYHWTSSQNSQYNSWYVYWSVEMLYAASKNNGYNVRAFTTLKSDDGQQSGGNAKIVTFYIAEDLKNSNFISYQAEEGMTFGEWVVSDYNTDGYYTEEGGMYTYIISPYTHLFLNVDGRTVRTIDTIIEGYYYYLG